MHALHELIDLRPQAIMQAILSGTRGDARSCNLGP